MCLHPRCNEVSSGRGQTHRRMPTADRNCTEATVVTPEDAEVRRASCERTESGDSALDRERVSRVCEHERRRAFSSDERGGQRCVPSRKLAAVDGDEHRGVEVRSDARLLRNDPV